MMNPFLQVALGGAAGAVARYGVNRATMAVLGPGFPVATLIVNVVGSFLMGLLVVLLATRGNAWAPLLMTGALGGFTTFSAFSLDALTLWQRGQHGAAAAYVLLSVGLSLSAIVAGLAVGRAA
ncbi:fluoride efflux transporter CrcB [uncultured Paracoccus sp.]|uniref:fluoride efflux transporter CrcB n=1 Tax=uncultured Paracoccus sp. TaxID=189685 RepID=UPI00262AB71B|nr:fluoride efflux transporter CrcB [uncultured Paracoccus sp.]